MARHKKGKIYFHIKTLSTGSEPRYGWELQIGNRYPDCVSRRNYRYSYTYIDNGLLYCKADIKDFCKAIGIKEYYIVYFVERTEEVFEKVILK